MHYLLSIVLPPKYAATLEETIAKLLLPYREDNFSGEEREFAFWDYYRLGGRFAGENLMRCFPKDTLDAFYEKLQEKKVTVSAVRCGKPKLQPQEQIPMVDAIWREFFPDWKGPCPAFKHGGEEHMQDDVIRVKQLTDRHTCERAIVAREEVDASGTPELRITTMLQWDEETSWDRRILSAIEFDNRHMKEPTDFAEYLVVTVDYHT